MCETPPFPQNKTAAGDKILRRPFRIFLLFCFSVPCVFPKSPTKTLSFPLFQPVLQEESSPAPSPKIVKIFPIYHMCRDGAFPFSTRGSLFAANFLCVFVGFTISCCFYCGILQKRPLFLVPIDKKSMCSHFLIMLHSQKFLCRPASLLPPPTGFFSLLAFIRCFIYLFSFDVLKSVF